MIHHGLESAFLRFLKLEVLVWQENSVAIFLDILGFILFQLP